MPRRNQTVRLLVRGDDFGSAHAANRACIDAFRNGILRSVEIMAPCPWFEQACRLAHENPDLDVGIHLVLTSEWDEYKWRPLRPCPSIVDDAGYLPPLVWSNQQFHGRRSLQSADWNLDEIEAELRAQIELCLDRIPHVTHLSGHMGWETAHLEFSALFNRLTQHYGLARDEPLELMECYEKSGSPEAQALDFASKIARLTPGTWLFIEHPAHDFPEMEGVHLPGYHDVGRDRGDVTAVLTSPVVAQTVRDRGIRLISYRDLR